MAAPLSSQPLGIIYRDPMAKKKIPQATQTNVFVTSRRRCCICFSLERDDARKRGQIAHLDGNPENNDPANLAYLCLDHHDEYDGSTSQSKGLTIHEVKEYRDELYRHFADWSMGVKREHLLNFVATQITNAQIAKAVVDVASGVYFYGPRHAHDVLTLPEVNSSDPEILLNHLFVLDSCASWGLLTYQEEDIYEDGKYEHTLITVNHLPSCADLAEIIEGWIEEKGQTNWQ